MIVLYVLGMALDSRTVKQAAAEAGFELVGITPATPHPDWLRYNDWTVRGFAGRMSYLSDNRSLVRRDPRSLLPSAKSVICVGKVYNAPQPYSNSRTESELGWISRYAWGTDYHQVVRFQLQKLADKLLLQEDLEYRVCVDTAPLLERSYAQSAGLGWIGKNTCLINQSLGSWVFLGELLISIELEPDHAPPMRCGTCSRCIDTCPTKAIVPQPDGDGWELDARLCISYFTIELKGAIPEEHRTGLGHHIFGCDICQDVCPWNRKAAVTDEPAFQPRHQSPALENLAAISKQEFHEMFRDTPIERTRYSGFLRNVAVAMGNSGLTKFRPALERLAMHEDEIVREHADWALSQLK